MAARRSGLGRGLDSLIPSNSGTKQEKPAAKAEKTASKSSSKAAKPAAKPAAKAEKAAEQPAAKAAKPAKASKPAAKSSSKAAKPAAKPSEAAAIPAPVVPVPAAEEKTEGSVVMMKIALVEPNRAQPRKEFDKERLTELAESIRQFGVISPLLVQKMDDHYEIIAGERRWRAAQIAGLKEIPVIIRDYSKQEAVEISLIENIQREDLNPIEEAKAYVRLMDEFTLTQEQIAGRVAKSRSAVTNAMRLLRLPDDVQEMLIYGDLSEGHARALLSLPDGGVQVEAARKIVKEGLSVRDTEKLVKKMTRPSLRRVGKTVNPAYELIFKEFEQQLKDSLGTKVSIVSGKKGRGKIEIEYYSDAELERLLALLSDVQGGEVN